MRITLSQTELVNIILDYLKKRGITPEIDTVKFERYEDYEGFCGIWDDIRAVATIKEEGDE